MDRKQYTMTVFFAAQLVFMRRILDSLSSTSILSSYFKILFLASFF